MYSSTSPSSSSSSVVSASRPFLSFSPSFSVSVDSVCCCGRGAEVVGVREEALSYRGSPTDECEGNAVYDDMLYCGIRFE